jgi:hypothetical protein
LIIIVIFVVKYILLQGSPLHILCEVRTITTRAEAAVTIRARALVAAYQSTPAPTSDEYRERIRAELKHCDGWVDEARIMSLTPWLLLVYVLRKGELGRTFNEDAIVHMVAPRHPDLRSARERVSLALSNLGLTGSDE